MSRAAVAEDQRRMDSLVSRVHSRTISRGDGGHEFMNRDDVALAAAKKLEELSHGVRVMS